MPVLIYQSTKENPKFQEKELGKAALPAGRAQLQVTPQISTGVSFPVFYLLLHPVPSIPFSSPVFQGVFSTVLAGCLREAFSLS